MIYNVKLDSNELNELARKLDVYATRFELKIRTFLKMLADLAIDVAQTNEGDFAGLIVYSKVFETNEGGQTVKMVAKSDPITRAWYASSISNEVRTEEISPLLMAEFGSGHKAISASGEAEGMGGQGTLNLYHHAFDSNGWYWWTDEPNGDSDAQLVNDTNGRFKYHSYGQAPSQPLHNAVMACIREVEGIAREVFG